MNDLREKIIDIIKEVDRSYHPIAPGWFADRILSLLPAPEAEAKLPEGVELFETSGNWWDVRTATHYLHHSAKEWVGREEDSDQYGSFCTYAAALAAALQAPPVPEVEKPDPRKIAPNGRAMVEYRMRNDALYGLDDERVWWWFTKYGRWDDAHFAPRMGSEGIPCTFDGSPLPTETKSRDGCKPSPNVTFADMRRLAEVLDNSRSSWISRAINEVFKEPA